MAQIGVDIGSYTFDSVAKTITFTGVNIDTIEQIKPIVNGTTGEVIFNPAEAGAFGSLSANVLTLDKTPSTTWANTDELYICVNLGKTDSPFLIFGTTTPLAASATFFSGVLSLVNKSQVETRVLSDTDGTLVFDFYEDEGGANLVRSLSIPYIGGSGYQYFAAPAFSNYVEYKFINSAAIQTAFLYETKVLTSALSGQIVRLDGTIVSGMVAPVVRGVLTGLDDFGNYRNAGTTVGGNLKITPHDSSTNARQIIDFNGAAKVGEAMILAGDVFGGVSPSSNKWDFSGTGSNVTQAGNERIETGTTANGSRQFQTIKKARFMGAQFNIFHGGINLPDLANPDTIFRFGPFNPSGTSNGSYFEVEGGVSPSWYLVTVKNGVSTKVPENLWTGPGVEGFNAMPGLAVYEIIYNAGTVNFFQGPNLLHTQSVGKLGETYANSYNFNVGFEVENINGNTTNNGIEIYAGVIYRLGEERGELVSEAYTSSTLVKSGAGYVGNVALSRTGSAGGSGTVIVYDGIDNTGRVMGRLDVGGDDVKSITLNGTYSVGLYIEIIGTGTNTTTLNSE